MEMEEFFEKKEKYSHDNPCPLCGYPIEINNHNPDWCENAREDLEIDETKEKETEWQAPADKIDFTQFMPEEGPIVKTEPEIKKAEKPTEKEKELSPRLQSAITEINDWLKEATRVNIARDFEEKLKKILVKNEIRVPRYQWEALKRVEAPPFAQDLLEKFKKDWHNKMQIRGIL